MRTLIIALAACNLAMAVAGIYSVRTEHARAERYKTFYEDSVSIIEAQNGALDSAQQVAAMANGMVDTCIAQIQKGTVR